MVRFVVRLGLDRVEGMGERVFWVSVSAELKKRRVLDFEIGGVSLTRVVVFSFRGLECYSVFRVTCEFVQVQWSLFLTMQTCFALHKYTAGWLLPPGTIRNQIKIVTGTGIAVAGDIVYHA
jgi:hypothetical protein